MTTRKIKALKRAVEEHEEAEDVFFPTKSDFLYWFTFINSAMFDNCLRMPDEFQFRRLRGAFGIAIGDTKTGRTVIRLKERFTSEKIRSVAVSSRQMFIATLAHEMVHILEFQISGTMKHGTFFRNWKKKFAEIGIIL